MVPEVRSIARWRVDAMRRELTAGGTDRSHYRAHAPCYGMLQYHGGYALLFDALCSSQIEVVGIMAFLVAVEAHHPYHLVTLLINSQEYHSTLQVFSETGKRAGW